MIRDPLSKPNSVCVFKVDMTNYGDQRYLVNPLSQVSASEFKCTDCTEY